jgi:hypothetical protein
VLVVLRVVVAPLAAAAAASWPAGVVVDLHATHRQYKQRGGGGLQ